MTVDWYCARCAEGKDVEDDPVVVRLCTGCHVETYCRPFGHAGENVTPTAEQVLEAHTIAVKQSQESLARAGRKAEPAKEKKKEPEPEPEPEEVPPEEPEEPPEKAIEDMSVDELRAKLKELEGA